MIRFIIISILFFSCNNSKFFSKEELMFFEPFSESDTVVFKSDSGYLDTIVFFKLINDTVKYRSIEQGFYNNNILKVGYEITKGSYHKFLTKSVTKEPEFLMSFSKSKRSYSNKQISFLGLLFDERYLNQIAANKHGWYEFDERYAVKSGMNINEGIKRFIFDFKKGIVSFVDYNGIEWTRIE